MAPTAVSLIPCPIVGLQSCVWGRVSQSRSFGAHTAEPIDRQPKILERKECEKKKDNSQWHGLCHSHRYLYKHAVDYMLQYVD